MKIVERTFTREVAVRREVALWDYLDFEHLTRVHAGYVRGELIYEDEKVALEHLTLRVPFFPFLHSQSVHFIVKRLPEEILAWNVGLFSIPSATRIEIQETSSASCRVQVTYRFALAGARQLLIPFLPRLLERWNEKVWQEDLPLRMRREEVLRRGFVDFQGFREPEAPAGAEPFSIKKSLLFPYPHGPLLAAGTMPVWHSLARLQDTDLAQPRHCPWPVLTRHPDAYLTEQRFLPVVHSLACCYPHPN